MRSLVRAQQQAVSEVHHVTDAPQDQSSLVVETPHDSTSGVQLQHQGMFRKIVSYDPRQPQLQGSARRRSTCVYKSRRKLSLTDAKSCRCSKSVCWSSESVISRNAVLKCAMSETSVGREGKQA